MLGSRTSSTWMHMLGPNPRSPDSQTLGFQFPAICFNTSCKCFWDMFNFEIQWRRSYILIQMFYLPVQIISLLMLVIHMFNKMVHTLAFLKNIFISALNSSNTAHWYSDRVCSEVIPEKLQTPADSTHGQRDDTHVHWCLKCFLTSYIC